MIIDCGLSALRAVVPPQFLAAILAMGQRRFFFFWFLAPAEAPLLWPAFLHRGSDGVAYDCLFGFIRHDAGLSFDRGPDAVDVVVVLERLEKFAGVLPLFAG